MILEEMGVLRKMEVHVESNADRRKKVKQMLALNEAVDQPAIVTSVHYYRHVLRREDMMS